MSNPNDFIIENGVLKKYVGSGGDVVIPEGMTSIGAFAFFNCSNLTSVTIPESVTSIGDSAFYSCSSLTNVTIPDGVKSIGKSVFRDCSSLVSITLPEGVTSIGGWAFYNCSSLTSMTIPEGVTDIGDSAFEWCSSLTNVTIPESVTSIGDSAFEWCHGLTSVVIPDSVARIGKKSFDDKTHIMITDIDRLPASLRPGAALSFAENGGEKDSPAFRSHSKYIRGNAAKLVDHAMKNPTLLALMCREKLITPKNVELYVEAAQKSGNAQALALLQDYQANKIDVKQKEALEKRKKRSWTTSPTIERPTRRTKGSTD